jgi:5-methylcytosine-specific restriction endonuclease McrA
VRLTFPKCPLEGLNLKRAMIGLFLQLIFGLLAVLIQVIAIFARLVITLVVSLVGAVETRGRHRPHNGAIRRAIPSDVRWTVFRRDRYRCRFCGSHHDLTIDHIYPVSRGGTNELTNLQTLCRRCNSSKGASVPVFASPGVQQRHGAWGAEEFVGLFFGLLVVIVLIGMIV